jgi:hypothetical protein
MVCGWWADGVLMVCGWWAQPSGTSICYRRIWVLDEGGLDEGGLLLWPRQFCPVATPPNTRPPSSGSLSFLYVLISGYR